MYENIDEGKKSIKNPLQYTKLTHQLSFYFKKHKL